MKKTIKYIFSVSLCLGLALAVSSCVDDINVGDGFLEKAPGVDVDINTIFSKKENTEYFLWNLYGQIYNPHKWVHRSNQCPIEAITDIFHSYEGWGGPNEDYYPADLQPTNGPYQKFMFIDTPTGDDNNAIRPGIWSAVRKAWIIIENIDSVPDMTEDEKSHVRAEAYLIMATRYFDCFRHFGGLPLVDHAMIPGEEFDGTRASVAGTVEFIDGLLQKAIDESGFPWRHPNPDDTKTGAGRLSKAAAHALRAKLWVFAASPLFNDDAPYHPRGDETTWLGGKKQEYWQKALEYCEAFFALNQQNGGYYALIQPATQDEAGYCAAFRSAYWYRGNSEKIIEVHQSYTAPGWGWSDEANLMNASFFGFCNPTLDYMEMFPMADGRPYPYKSVMNTNNPDNVDIFASRDPRLYETILAIRPQLHESVAGLNMVQFWQGGEFDINNGNFFNGGGPFRSGMRMYKFILDYNRVANYPINFAYLRMADMHLLYAEALAETGDLQKACDEVNKVRARVGLGRIETMNPSLNLTSNKDNLIAEIMRERACEFGQEDSRLHDINRRKMIDRYTTPLREIVIWRKTADGQKDTSDDTTLATGEAWPNFIYDERVISTYARKWWEPNGWDNKWFLSPIPRDEVNKGYGLTQNPGW